MDHHEIVENLKSDDSAVVIEALEELLKEKSMHNLSLSIPLIKSNNSAIKKAAIDTTVSIIKSSIIDNYKELDKESKKKLVQIIDTIHPDIVNELIRDVHGVDIDNKIHALIILGLLKKRPEIKNLLTTQLKSQNEKVRATATLALSNYGNNSDTYLLMQKLSDQDVRVRANAVEAIENVGDPKMKFSVKRLVNDGNNRVRANALKALYSLGDHDIDNYIADMLSSNENSMVASGLWVMTELELFSPELMDIAKSLLESSDPIVKSNAKLVMDKYNG